MIAIITSILLTAGIFIGAGLKIVKKENENGYGHNEKLVFKMNPMQLLAVLGIIPLLISCIAIVPVNSVGIKFNQFSGVQEDVLTEGLKFKSPFDKIYVLSTEIRTKTVENVTGQTRDAQWIKISMDIKYSVSQVNAFTVFRQFKTLEAVDETLLTPLVQRAIEEVMTKYNVIDILGEERNAVYTEIELAVKTRLQKSGIEFFSLVLLDTDAGQAIEQAIEREAVAKKEVETASQAQAKANVEAQTKVIQASAAAEVKIIEAEAAAKMIAINAEAEAEANRKISASLTNELLRKMEMEARIKHGWIEITGATPIVVK